MLPAVLHRRSWLAALLLLAGAERAGAAWHPTISCRVATRAASRRCLHSPRAQEWAAPAERESPWATGEAAGEEPPSVWGDADFSAEWGGALDDEAAENGAPEDGAAGAWGDGSWGDADEADSWEGEESDGSASADLFSPSPSPGPAPVRREIECTNVWIVSTPFKRRNGIYAEVTLQHKEAADTVTTLWFANEVRGDEAAHGPPSPHATAAPLHPPVATSPRCRRRARKAPQRGGICSVAGARGRGAAAQPRLARAEP